MVVEDGSTASTAILWPDPVNCLPKHSKSVDFPAPGGPDRPVKKVCIDENRI